MYKFMRYVKIRIFYIKLCNDYVKIIFPFLFYLNKFKNVGKVLTIEILRNYTSNFFLQRK